MVTSLTHAIRTTIDGHSHVTPENLLKHPTRAPAPGNPATGAIGTEQEELTGTDEPGDTEKTKHT